MKELEKSMIAVDIGSANIKFLVGYMDNEVLHIIHSSCEPSKGIVRGDVVNEKMVSNIIVTKFKSLIKLYESYDENKGFKIAIKSFALSFNNVKLTSSVLSVSDSRDLEFKVTENVLKSMDGSLSNRILDGGKRIYYSNILDYLLKSGDDEDSTIDPIDADVDSIDGNYHAVVGDSSLQLSIISLLGKTKMDLAKNLPVSSLSPELFIDRDELRIGVGIVDIGAELTTLSIFRFRKLHSTYVIPIGSKAVSNDLANRFEISFDVAEKLKVNHGLNVDSSTKLSSSSFLGSSDIDADIYKQVIKARYAQIFEHVLRYIKVNNFDNKISSLVLTGGGSRVSELSGFITKKFRRHVVLGELDTNKVEFKDFNLGMTAVLSILKWGQDNIQGKNRNSFSLTENRSFIRDFFNGLEN